MIVRFIFSTYFTHCVISTQWDTSGFLQPSPLLGMQNVNPDRKQTFDLGYNPHLEILLKKVPQHNQRIPVVEVLKPNSKCYDLKTVTKMMRGFINYIKMYPNKIDFLDYLINFLQDEDENPNKSKVRELVNIIDSDQRLPLQEKQTLRNMLNIDMPPKIDKKTKIVFKYELPSLNQPECKRVFVDLMEAAYDKYMQLVKQPMCQVENNMYDKSDTQQRNLPEAETGGSRPDFMDQVREYFGFDPFTVKPYYPEKPNTDNLFQIPNKHNSPHDKPKDLNDFAEIINDLFPNSPDFPGFDKPRKNEPEFLPDGNTFPSKDKTEPPPDNLTPPVGPQNPGSINDLVISILNTLRSDGKSPANGNNIGQIINDLPQISKNYGLNPKLIPYIVEFLKSGRHGVHDSKIIAMILELFSRRDGGQTSSKLIEILLPILIKNKSPDPKLIQIIIPLLKVQKNTLDPKIVELILALLKLNKNDVIKNKYQIIFSLLYPNDKGDINPKIIEIINELLKVNENLQPNDKIIHYLFSLLMQPDDNKLLNPKSIDILLNALKLNDNHRLPDNLFYLILQFLLKISLQNQVKPNLNIYSNPPLPYLGDPHMTDQNLLIVLLNNPNLLKKLLDNKYGSKPDFQPYPIGSIAPNVFNPNTLGVMELTYLLKHPQPFVYQPFYYVKYRLPVSTFTANLKNLLMKKPHLTSDPTKLYQELIPVSNVTDLSPNLKGYSKEDIMKMTKNNGALVTAKIIDDRNINIKEQLKIVQDLNADVQPEDILKQTQDVKLNGVSQTQSWEQLMKLLLPEIHTDSVGSNMMNTGTPVIQNSVRATILNGGMPLMQNMPMPGSYPALNPNNLRSNPFDIWRKSLLSKPFLSQRLRQF